MAHTFDSPVTCPIIIGRTTELSALHSLIEYTKSGQGQVVLLAGEAGIGKSRLVAEAKEYATNAGFLSLQGQCFPADRSCPYAPLLDLMRSYFTNASPERVSTELGPLAVLLFPLLPDLFSLPSDLTTLPALDAEQEKQRLFATLTQFFLRKTSQQPLLVIVEDLHWSDDTSLEFLQYLARHCIGFSLLILLTYRSEEVHPGLRRFLAYLDRQRLTKEFFLPPLMRDEVRAMLHVLLARRRAGTLSGFLKERLLDTIYTLTEGNPFFVEELLPILITAGDRDDVPQLRHGQPFADLQMPRSIQDAVQQQTQHLSERAQHVLALAAVAGRRFDYALMQQVVGLDEQELLQGLKELLSTHVVVEESADHFAFRHELTRQAVQAGLLARERRQLHGTLAETIEHLYAPKLEAHLADLASHFFAAESWEKALEYAQRAGDQSQRLSAPRAAIDHYTRALDAARRLALLPPPAIQRARGQAYEALGEFEAALGDYEQTYEAAHQRQERVNEWQSLLDLGRLWAGRDYHQAGEWFERALELAQHLADPVLQAHTLNHMGQRFTFLAQPFEALQCHQQALALFEQTHDSDGLAETLDCLGLFHYGSGDLIAGATYYEQAVSLLRTHTDPQRFVDSLVLLMLCKGTNYHNDVLTSVPATLAESLQLGEEALQVARASGQRTLEAYVLICQAGCLGPHGNYARAMEAIEAGLTILQEFEHRRWLIDAHWFQGALYLDLLAPTLAQEHLEHALALAHEVDAPGWERMVTSLLTLAYLQQQDLVRAESTLGTLRNPQTRRLGQRMAWCARAELALAQGDPRLALEIVEQLIKSAADVSGEAVIPRLAHLRGKALLLLQRLEEAERTLQEADAAAQLQGTVSRQWRIAIDLGALYLAQHRGEEAAQAYAAAQHVIEEVATSIPHQSLRETFLAQATALLPPSQTSKPRRGSGPLTDREREVVRLLAQGFTNQQIAASLVVSERTVNSHLVRIFNKLGVNNRAAAATYAVRQGLIE